jgi:periplasmic copper chaperone A
LKISLAGPALLALFIAVFALPTAAGAEDSPNVSIGTLFIEGAFTRPTAPGAKNAMGYLSIINEGSVPDRLVSVGADISDKSELHETKTVNGTTQTQILQNGIEIPAGATVNLAPGGDHVSFLNIHHPVKAGDIIHATLGFENAGRIDIGFHAEPGLSKETKDQ